MMSFAISDAPARSLPHQDEDFWVVAGTKTSHGSARTPQRTAPPKGVLIGDRKRAVGAADSILYIDPPRHVTHRRIVNRAFTVRRVAGLAPVVERITRDALEAIDPTAPVEAVDAD